MINKTVMKNLGSFIVAITFGVVVALFLGEGLLRIFAPQPLYSFEKGLFMSSDEYGYCLTPNVTKTHSQPEYSYTITSNSYGFRGHEPQGNAAFRVMVLGASFGMGQGVKEGENLCEVAQHYFTRQGEDIDIFNTSISGYSGINEVKVLKALIGAYKPHAVILFFSWNDIGAKESLVVQDGHLLLKSDISRSMKVREWLNNNSHLFCLIKKYYYIQKMKKPLQQKAYGSTKKERLTVASDRIAEMKKICDQYGALFTAVMLPLDHVFQQQEGYLKDKGILFEEIERNMIDLRDWNQFYPHERSDELTYVLDNHWNAQGHEYFSNYLIDMIYEARGTQ